MLISREHLYDELTNYTTSYELQEDRTDEHRKCSVTSNNSGSDITAIETDPLVRNMDSSMSHTYDELEKSPPPIPERYMRSVSKQLHVHNNVLICTIYIYTCSGHIEPALIIKKVTLMKTENQKWQAALTHSQIHVSLSPMSTITKEVNVHVPVPLRVAVMEEGWD